MIQPQTTLAQNHPYIPGHADPELDRLIRQAHFYGELSMHVLQLAGSRPGMRVLDVGCGAGDVSFLAAKCDARFASNDRRVDAKELKETSQVFKVY